MNIIVSKGFENRLSPTLSDYGISLFLMIYGLFFIIWFCVDTISHDYYLPIFNIIIFGMFPLVIAIPVLFTNKCYINYEQKYLRVDARIIPFSEVSNFHYKHAFSSFRHPLACIFVLTLKTGEKVEFYCYFKGSNIRVCDALKKAELLYIDNV